MYVDTHTHLTHASFADDVDAVIKRAVDGGMGAIVVSGVNRPSNENVLALARKYPIVKASLGLYPIDMLGLGPDESGMEVQKGPIDLDEEFAFIEQHKDEVVSIGEVGLDYHWDKEHHKQQQENFSRIIEFTEKLGKPIVLHTRKAEQDCIDMIESSSVKHVVLHSFMGKKKLIKRAADLGYYFSIPTLVVRSPQFQQILDFAPLSQIFTETDAPYLGPRKDERNEPVFVKESVAWFAEKLGMSKDEVREQIWENYDKVFGKHID